MSKKVTVAQYIEQMIALSDKSQKEIAQECGYSNPNIMSMFKQGLTKLPINKVAPFAKAVGADPVHLLRLVMQEYMPETWESIEGIVGQSLISPEEFAAVKAIRKGTGGVDLNFTNKEIAKVLEECVASLAESEVKERRASAKQVRVKHA
jgi:AraC-like DNA-binding protein